MLLLRRVEVWKTERTRQGTPSSGCERRHNVSDDVSGDVTKTLLDCLIYYRISGGTRVVGVLRVLCSRRGEVGLYAVDLYMIRVRVSCESVCDIVLCTDIVLRTI